MCYNPKHSGQNHGRSIIEGHHDSIDVSTNRIMSIVSTRLYTLPHVYQGPNIMPTMTRYDYSMLYDHGGGEHVLLSPDDYRRSPVLVTRHTHLLSPQPPNRERVRWWQLILPWNYSKILNEILGRWTKRKKERAAPTKYQFRIRTFELN